MRHWNDLHESLAAPSPFVPTCRPRSPLLSSKPTYGSGVYCSMATAKQPCPIANNGPADDNNNNPLHHLSSVLAESSHKSDEDVAAELVQYLQAAQAQSASASVSLPSTSSTTSPVSEMFKAGHRRLRQLAQRQKKETDPDAKADDESRQLSALQREGLLPASALKKEKAHAKKKSIDSTPSSSKSVSNVSCKSSSRRDVERIGRPWLDDPLERCMMDPLSSGRLASLEIGDLSSFMETAMSGDSLDSKPAPVEKPASPKRSSSDRQKPAQPPAVGGSEPASDKAETSTNNDAGKAPTTPSINEPPKDGKHSKDTPAHEASTRQTKPEKSNNSQPSSKDSSNKDKPPKPDKHTLKLFPDPLPPRISSKHAWRLSKCPPANAPQPAASSSQQSPLPTESSKSPRNPPSPIAESSTPKQPMSAPASTQHFANTEKEKPAENTNNEQSKDENNQPSSLPMCAINAFPLPAPTRPLPLLPQSVAAGAEHDRKAAPKKKVHRKGTPRDLQLPSNLTRGDPRPNSTEPPTPPRQQIGRDPAPVPESALTGRNRLDKVRALKKKDISVHRLHVDESNEEPTPQSFDVERAQAEAPPKSHNGKKANRRSVEFARRVQTNTIPGSPSSSAPSLTLSPNRRVHPYGHRAGALSPTSPVLPYKHSEPMLASGPRENLPIRRSNSSRVPNLRDEEVEQKVPLRSEYPIPSSDEEGINIGSKPRANQAQKKRRGAKPYKATDPARPLHRVPRIEKPAQLDTMLSLSPQDPSVGGSSPLSQYSQSTCHSHDSRTLTSLEGRIAQLERQNKVLQAALFAALDAGNKESNESTLSGTVASLLSASAVPSSKTTPASSMLDEPAPEIGGFSRPEKSSNRRDTWLDTRSTSSRSSMQSSNFSAYGKELEVIHDIDLDWLSDKSSVGDSLKVQV